MSCHSNSYHALLIFALEFAFLVPSFCLSNYNKLKGDMQGKILFSLGIIIGRGL